MLKKWIYILTTYQNKIEIIAKTNIYFNDFKLKRMSLSEQLPIGGYWDILWYWEILVKTPTLYTTDKHVYNSSINIWSISFFSPFDMHQSHHLLEWQATDSSSSLTVFFYVLCVFQIHYAWQKSWLQKKFKRYARQEAVVTK